MDKNNCDKPQFSGERVKVPLGSLGKVVTGNTPSKKNERYWATEDVPFIKPGDIDESAVTYLTDGTEYIADYAIGKARCVGAGSVLVTCIGTIAKIAVVNCNCIAFNQQINAIDVDRNVVDPQYLAYALKANNTRLKMLANAPVVPIINKRQFESFVLPVHSDLNVQREIVSQFTAIGSQRQRLDEELCHLDNLVKSRFNEMLDGADDGLISLGELAQSKMTPARKVYSDNDIIKYIDIGSIDNTAHLVLDCQPFRMGEAPSRAQQCVRQGDLLVSTVRPKLKNIALIDSAEDCLVASSGFCVLRSQNCLSEYLRAVVCDDRFTDEMCRLTTGANYPAIKAADVLGFKTPKLSMDDMSGFSAFVRQVDKLRFMLLGNPLPMFGHRSFCCSTNSGNGGVILEAKDY